MTYASLFLLVQPPLFTQTAVTNYIADTTTTFKNPERGFSYSLGLIRSPSDARSESAWSTVNNSSDSCTVAYEGFVLFNYRNSTIPQSYLDVLTSELAKARRHGVKLYISFHYTDSIDDDTTGTADTTWMKIHMDQLAPILQANADVIGFAACGWVGKWGEWGDAPVWGNNPPHGYSPSPRGYESDSVAQATIISKFLSIIPPSRKIYLRTPRAKYHYTHIYRPMNFSEFLANSAQGRIGWHNDAFHGNLDNSGTFYDWGWGGFDTSFFRSYMKVDTRYIPLIAEVNDGDVTWGSPFDPTWFPNNDEYLRSYTEPIGREGAEYANMHATLSTNTSWPPAWVAAMKARGYWPTITKKLGYRFQLLDSEVPSSANPAGPFRIRFRVTNTGWATPANPRGLEIILRNDVDPSRKIRINIFSHKSTTQDPRLWWSGETIQVDTTVTIPQGADAGVYSVLLSLPDTCARLYEVPEYSIRLANKDVWESSTGYNNLLSKVSIEVSKAAPPPVPVPVWPPDGGTDLPTSLSVSWEGSTEAQRYHLQVASDIAFGAMVVDDSLITETSRQVSGLENNRTYYWRVKAINGVGGSPYSATSGFTTRDAPPAAPSLRFPTNGSTEVPPGVVLEWDAALGATSYHLQVALDASFTSLLLDDSALAATSRQVGSLQNNTRYYWRVRGKNSAGSGPFSLAWDFTTIMATPPLNAPASGATGQPTSPLLRWGSSTGAVNYHLQVSADPLFVTTVVNDSDLTETSQEVGPLANDSRYYWRVRARGSNNASAYSAVWNFTTISPAPQIPSTPGLLWPPDNAVDQPPTFFLSWSPSSEATSYQLQVALDSLFQAPIFDDSMLTGTSIQVGPLEHARIYYWRVRARNSAGVSNFSAVWRFSTIVPPPDPPDLLAPASGATGLPTTVLLSWSSSGYASSYRLQVSWDPLFQTTVLDDTSITGTSREVGPLGNDSTYYWRVSARNKSGSSSFSAARNFKTIVRAPLAPELVSPAHGATGQATSTTLVWHRSPRATLYHLEVAADPLFSAIVVNSSGVTDTAYAVQSLDHLATYYWRVRGANDGGISAHSAIWSFTTISAAPALPATPGIVSPQVGASGQALRVLLSWSSSPEATNYQLQVAADSLFLGVVFDDSTLTGTTHEVGPLLPQTQYYWRVRARNSAGMSAYSTVGYFKTELPLPGTVSLISPSSGSVGQPTTVSLRWGSAALASAYWLQVALDSLFQQKIQNDSAITASTFQLGPLANDTRFYWRAAGTNARGAGPWSPVWQFKTIVAAPEVPALASPVLGDTVRTTPVPLVWVATARATSYRVQMATDAQFQGLVFDESGIAEASRQITGLRKNVQYFWHVKAANAGGESEYSETWSFYLGTKPVPRGSFTGYPDVLPAGGGVVTLAWTSIDADAATIDQGIGAVPLNGSVNVFVDSSKNFTLTLSNTEGVTTYLVSVFVPPPSSKGPDDATLNGLPIARITNPRGLGSPNIETIRDGITPEPGSNDLLKAYDTFNTNVPRLFDWIGYEFSSRRLFSNVDFQEGSEYAGGGTFAVLKVQVRVDGSWTDVRDLQCSPPYAGANAIGYEMYNLQFRPISGDAIRIAGDLGGPWHFVSVAELRVFDIGVAPAIPTLLTPQNLLTVSPSSIVLRWQRSPGAMSYRVQVSVDSLFSGLILDDSTVVDTLRELTSLAPVTRYYWRVLSKNGAGTNGWSEQHQFITHVYPPAAVITIAPLDHASIPGPSVELVWRKSIPPALTYWLEWSEEPSFARPGQDSTLTDTSFALSGLYAGSSYWWRVRAKNEAGWGSFGAASTFTVVDTSQGKPSSPSSFDLSQNYPNPFNPRTQIAYSIPHATEVVLKVYNILGQEVRTLVNGFTEAGTHTISLDGANLASGMYVYSMQVDGHHFVKRMLLIK